MHFPLRIPRPHNCMSSGSNTLGLNVKIQWKLLIDGEPCICIATQAIFTSVASSSNAAPVTARVGGAAVEDDVVENESGQVEHA
jgi:hypothetical protein